MTLITGFMIFLGMFLSLIKSPRLLMLEVLKHDLLIGMVVSIFVLMIHFGAFSGVMAATNLFCQSMSRTG